MSLDRLLGKKIKNDVTNEKGLVLIPARYVLDLNSLELLQQHAIDFTDIILWSDNDVETDSPESLVKEAVHYAQDLFERMKYNKKIPLLEIRNELIPIVQQASEHPDLFQLFEAVKAKDEYTHQHNIGVGVLSTLIGKWLNMDEVEVALLSVAATLHDVGKVRISTDILNKPGKLTEDEFEEMKLHTVYGYSMLKDTVGLSSRGALVALQHHERANGKGYPLGLTEHQIDPLSRIVAVADVFHAMSSKRPYHEALPFFEVVSRMRSGFFGELDPYIVSVFLENLTRNLLGRRVRLTDGRWGEVVYLNPHDDTHPMVKVDQSFVDLSKDLHVHIQDIIL
ncbi:HD-GYP domain-containing protein [Paenibacillus sp. N3.4]|uniref:HD-GYP domain-containing protein n=1 Tax=Paenibacillus sp. N3.4 TaxID=2603222 RepID=UPI0011C91580|nr:HD-GYP domain-containing protein [Paenibacillus sp. N3.4]TXK77960.1 HD-GYP domain-containing protein [Paenibacillus sp. N3.4]